jgi:hypothetical protein
MSSQTFEIRCPRCQTVLSADAASAHNCAAPAPQERAAQQVFAEQASTITTMGVKDYHRLVRANYIATEGPRLGRPGRFHAYLPFVILVIGLLVGAGVVFGHF